MTAGLGESVTVTVAGRQDLTNVVEQRLRELVAEGTSFADLTPQLILGDLRLEGTADPEAGFTALQEALAGQRRPFYVAAHGPGVYWALPDFADEAAGQSIADAIGRVAQEAGVGLVLEERRGKALPALALPDGWLRLRVEPREYYKRAVNLAVGEAWLPSRVVRNGREVLVSNQPVARYGEDAEGRVAQLLVDPFRSERLLATVVRALRQAPVHPSLARPASERDFAAAREALTFLPQMAKMVAADQPSRKQQLKGQLEQAEREVSAAQDALVAALAKTRELKSQLASVDSEMAALQGELAVRAVREAMRITRLPGVRQVELVQIDRRPWLRISFHPIVMRGHLLPRLVCEIPLVKPSLSNIRFSGSYAQSPHPHVRAGSGDVCWGDAQNHLSHSLSSGDFATAVTLISFWARLYNGGSPYVRIENFPAAPRGLKDGFHPELEA